MGKKHFSEEQIAFALRQAESGTSVAEIIRKLGISEQTFYRWKKRFAGLGIAELRRLRTLEEENKKLKQLVAERRACRVLGFSRTTYRYRSRRDPRAELRIRLRDLAASRVHYGYPRLWVLLRREGRRPGRPMRAGAWTSWPISWSAGNGSGS
jgi:putative transposase